MRVLLAFLLLAGCKQVTEIVVRVQSDVSAGATFTGSSGAQGTFAEVCFIVGSVGTNAVASNDDSLEVPIRTTKDVSGACLPIELGFAAKGDWSGDIFGIEVRGATSCTDDTYLNARAETQFVANEVMLLTVTLEPECVVDDSGDAACPAGQTCVVTQGFPQCMPMTVQPPVPYDTPTRTCP